MRRSLIQVFLLVSSLIASPTAGISVDQAQVQIHLPREIAVQESTLTLGSVAVVRGDPALVETVQRIGLGTLVVPGQKVTIDRTTITSRLASSGIASSQVTFTGANQVVVGRSGHTLLGADLAEAARQFLLKTPACDGSAVIEVVSAPKDLVIDGNHPDMQLVPRLAQASRSAGSVRVHVAAVSGKDEVAGQDVLLRLRYRYRKVVAAEDLSKGTPLSAQNVRIEEGLADQAQPSDWRPPYGRVLKRTVADNTEIRDDGLTDPVIAVTIKRNDLVVIRVERPGLLITAQGKAMTDGRIGEIVKVRNMDSNRIVLAKVKADGSVEPLL
jgi:flagellar basal body P-ring formation protein FlgA